MAGKQLQASEKKVLKISRDGVMERNLVQDTETRISRRSEDAILKAATSADELFGNDHKPREQAEQPKHHKPRFIDEQQDTGSKLQADYVTHEEETPPTSENNAPEPTPPVESTGFPQREM